MSAVTIIDANSKIAIANAEAIATVKSGEAIAAKITYEKDAEADHYGHLLSISIRIWLEKDHSVYIVSVCFYVYA